MAVSLFETWVVAKEVSTTRVSDILIPGVGSPSFAAPLDCFGVNLIPRAGAADFRSHALVP